MKFTNLAIAGILMTALLFAGCVQEERESSVNTQGSAECEFPRQIGAYTASISGEFPTIYAEGLHSYGNSTFVLAPYGLGDVKILVFDRQWSALRHYKNSNYYSKGDCEIIKGKADCLVESGKSTADRPCAISGVTGRCVSITDPVKRSWVVEFEWMEENQIKIIKMAGNAPFERSRKFEFLEPFVEQFKGCIVEVE